MHNGNRMHTQIECLILTSKNWAKLKYNYYICAEFLEEVSMYYRKKQN